MKLIYVILILALVSACNKKDDDDDEAINISGVDGIWLSEGCQDIGDGMFAKFYIVQDGLDESGLILAYDNSDCDGEYTTLNLAGDNGPTDEPGHTITITEIVEIEGIPDGYFVWEFLNSEDVTQYTLGYKTDDGKFYTPMTAIEASAGSTWADWEADDDLGAFAQDYTTGTSFESVEGLP